MRMLVIVLTAGLALAGCSKSRVDTNGPAPLPIPIEGDSIRYETGMCFGSCPVYAVTVRPDGTGVFEGKRFTAVSGEKTFRLSKAEYDAFAAKLAPYRPASGTVRYARDNPALCPMVATDMPSVDVTWTRAIGDSQGLHFYYGCHSEKNEKIGQALGDVIEALPQLEALIGARP